MLPKICIQMTFPLLRRNTPPHKRAHILIHIRQPHLKATHHALQMQQEVRALLVRDSAVGVVRILPGLEVDDEPLVLGVGLVLLERVLERLVADEEREAAVGGRVEGLQEETLDVGRPAFVKPEMGRVGLPVTYDGLGGAGLARRQSGKRTLRHCRTTSESFRAQLHRPAISCVRF